MQKDNVFDWLQACKDSFRKLIISFADMITLSYLDFSKFFVVDCNASDFGLCCCFFPYVLTTRRVAYFLR